MDLAKVIAGKKFMWDGSVYPDEKSAQDVVQKYKADGFETKVIKEEGKFFVFSRRVVKEIVLEGQPPV